MGCFSLKSKLSLFSLISIFSLVSCTTNTAAIDMRLPDVEAHVIGAKTLPRMVASIDDAEPYESAFQQILQANDSAGALKTYIDHAIRLFYRSQSLLNDYDAKIDEIAKSNGDVATLQTDDSYARLLAAWTVREKLHSKIRYFYSRSIEMQVQAEDKTQTPSPDLQLRSRQIDSVFKSLVMDNANAPDRLAKQDLIEDLMQTNDGFRQFQASRERQANDIVAKVEAFDKQLESQRMSDPKILEGFYKKNQSAINRRASVARTESETNMEIETLFLEAKKNLAEQFGSRLPQSAGISPQTGPNGMMSGSKYRDGRWSITFDDGPHAKFTPMALANLKQFGLKATFFWLADNVPRLASIVGQVREAGMTLACHSFTHPQLTKLSAAALRHEIIDAAHVETGIYGFKPTLFRCPYGACGSQTSPIRQMIANDGMVSITWNVDSLDWQDKNPVSVYNRVKKQMVAAKHGIILFHDIHPQSIAASKLLMADFEAGQKNGVYRVLTIQQAIDELNSPGGMQ